MACQYYAECDHCNNYYPDNPDLEKCEIFGMPIGDGSPFCNYFWCTIDECKRSTCISYEEELDFVKGF